jgi:hypothetical protein
VSAVAAAGTGSASGRTRVTTRALTSVISAITAETLEVDAAHVRVDLDDHNGHLGVTIRTPVGVPSLASLDAENGPDRTLLDRAIDVQHALKDRIPGLTGYTVSRVTVHLTGVSIRPERRVV